MTMYNASIKVDYVCQQKKDEEESLALRITEMQQFKDLRNALRAKKD